MAKIGDQLGKWTLRRIIGRGGQGEVFAATSGEGEEEIAIKVVKTTLVKKRNRFLQEIKTHAALSSKEAKNIIRLVDHNLEEVGEAGVQGFIAMPLAKSGLADHRDLLAGRVELCLEIFLGIVRGVESAHGAEIVHRDLKPNNVLFVDETLKNPLISDFGICFLRDTPTEERLTEVGETVGAKFFMAPEQERGGIADIQPSADLYALGKLLHHMLTGRFLFREEINSAFTGAELRSDPRYAAILGELLAKTIVPDPSKRMQSAAELLRIVDLMLRPSGGNGGGRTGGSPVPDPSNKEQAPSSTANPAAEELQAFRRFTKELAAGNAKAIGLEFDAFRWEFDDAWAKIYKFIETQPQQSKTAAPSLIKAQPNATAAMLAIARTDTERLFPDAKRFIEHILRSSERKSGYPAVFTVPHVQAGYYYMGMCTITLHFQSWDVLARLLTEKFEWYYQSGRPIFSRAFALANLFHIEALGRGASDAHDLYRELLQQDSAVKELGLDNESLLTSYLQAQFVMSLRGAQALQTGADIPLWPDYGRFHGYRVQPILDRMYHNDQYASQLLRSFGETKGEFFSRLNDRLALLSKRLRGGRYFWESIDSWEPRDSERG